MNFVKIIVLTFFLGLIFSACVSTYDQQPSWVQNWRSEFPDDEFLVQLGIGKTQEEAKNEALSAISFYLDSKVNGIRETNFHSIDSKIKQEIIRKTTVSTELNLFAVEYINPWYEKKSKNWYALCYINRESAWNLYRTELQNARNKVFSFYDKALNTVDNIEKIKYLNLTLDEFPNFLSKYSFAQMLLEEKTVLEFGEDLETLSKIKMLQQEAKNNSSFFLQVSGDVDSKIYSVLSNGLSSCGFTTSDKNYVYLVSSEVRFNMEEKNEAYFFTPALRLEILNSNNSVYSYSETGKSVKAYTENIGKIKAINELSKVLEETFAKDFSAFLGDK